MSKSPYKLRDPGRIVATVTRLVSFVGGAEAASRVPHARVGKSEMNRYTDGDDFIDRQMPVDIVLALEAHCGEPIVTEFMAAENGCVLLRIPREVTESWAKTISRLTDERADVVRAICESLDGDGDIDAREAGGAIDEIDEDMAVLAALRVQLVAIRDGESGA